VLLVGLGALGARHLQSLSKSNILIDVLEISQTNINSCLEIIDSNHLKKICFYKDSNLISGNYDTCIISTSSKPRLSIVMDLQKKCTWEFLILEKFLFPATDDFFKFKDFYQFDINKVFVNCPRRYYPDYNKIKLENRNQCTGIHVAGDNWGLSTNGIHFLDLHRYFTGEDIQKCTPKSIKKIKSKRKGYDEISGTIEFKTKSSLLKLECNSNSNTESFRIIINFEDRSYEINEIDGTQIIINDGIENESSFNTIYQSNLTEKYLNDLNQPSGIMLPNYRDSMKDHLLFLKSLKNIKNLTIT
jgi:hypothetical protein